MRRRKKGRRTLFQILFRDFAAVFVLMVMILVSLFFAFSFYRSKRDYLEYNQMLLKSIESRLDSYFTGLEEASKPILSSLLLWNAAMGLREEGLEEQLRISFSNLYYYSYHIKSVRLYLPETGRLYSMDRDVLVNNTPFVNSYEEGKVPENIQQAISEPGRYEYQMGQSEDLSVTVGFSVSTLSFAYISLAYGTSFSALRPFLFESRISLTSRSISSCDKSANADLVSAMLPPFFIYL